MTATGADEENAELIDMTRRFWVSTALALPVFILAMGAEFFPDLVNGLIAPRPLHWFEFALSTPVVLWGGWPFFVRGWQSVVNRSRSPGADGVRWPSTRFGIQSITPISRFTSRW